MTFAYARGFCPGAANGHHHWIQVQDYLSVVNLTFDQRLNSKSEDWRWCIACKRVEYDPQEPIAEEATK